MSLSRFPDYEDDLWKLLAFLGRYCNQPLSEMRRLPTWQARRLAEATASLMKDESPSEE